MQTSVLLVTLLLIAVVIAAFVRVILSTGEAAAAPAIERVRNRLFWGLVAFGVAVSGVSLASWPHATPADPAERVRVLGSQWSWEITPSELPAGVPVLFEVTATDVNHGFAVYDEGGTLLFQTQAMPGWINRVAWTFSEPGTYRVLCLEYCGLVHHDMLAELTVREREG